MDWLSCDCIVRHAGVAVIRAGEGTAEGHTGEVNSAIFAPDGGRILTGSDDRTARLWDLDGKPLATLQGHTGPVESTVFSPDGGRILTASADGMAMGGVPGTSGSR
jgi:WD40 repeat protein